MNFIISTTLPPEQRRAFSTRAGGLSRRDAAAGKNFVAWHADCTVRVPGIIHNFHAPGRAESMGWEVAQAKGFGRESSASGLFASEESGHFCKSPVDVFSKTPYLSQQATKVPLHIPPRTK